MVHEAGETARSIVDVFRSSPAMLASILMNLALIALLYWSGVVAERERTRSLELLYSGRADLAKLLTRCNLKAE